MPKHGHHGGKPSRAELGASLLESAALVFLVAAMLCVSLSVIRHGVLRLRAERTKKEMRLIHHALVGDSRAGNFGFLGDLGELPARLEHLVVSGGYPVYTTSGHVHGVGMGWAGPYLSKSPQDVRLDEFGRAYAFDRDGAGQLRSAGADGLFSTRDDIVFPPAATISQGSLHVDFSGGVDDGFTVVVYSSVAGVESRRVDSERPFVFEALPLGFHAVEVRRGRGPEGDLLVRRMIPLRGGCAFVSLELPGERSDRSVL